MREFEAFVAGYRAHQAVTFSGGPHPVDVLDAFAEFVGCSFDERNMLIGIVLLGGSIHVYPDNDPDGKVPVCQQLLARGLLTSRPVDAHLVFTLVPQAKDAADIL